MKRLVAGLAFLAFTLGAAAEVRVVETYAGVSLDVQPASGGIWTQTRISGRGFVLNPAGDAFGDGYPNHSSLESGLLVAWARRGEQVVIAEASHRGEAWRRVLDVEEVLGPPMVLAQPSGAIIAWAGPAGISAVRHLGGGEFSDVVPIDPGSLAALVPYMGGALLVAIDGSASMIRVWDWVPDPQPIPLFRLVVELPLATAPERGHSLQAAASIPCVKVSDDLAVVAWCVAPGTVRILRIDAGELAGVDDLRAGNACHAALLGR